MTHRATQIIDAVKAAVLNLPTTGDKVKVSRAFPTAKLPAISISQSGDQVERIISNAFYQRELALNLTILVDGDPDLLDNQVSQIEAEIWSAIMGDITLGGLDFVADINPDGLSGFQISTTNEIATLQADSVWRISYRHSLTDPEN